MRCLFEVLARVTNRVSLSGNIRFRAKCVIPALAKSRARIKFTLELEPICLNRTAIVRLTRYLLMLEHLETSLVGSLEAQS